MREKRPQHTTLKQAHNRKTPFFAAKCRPFEPRAVLVRLSVGLTLKSHPLFAQVCEYTHTWVTDNLIIYQNKGAFACLFIHPQDLMLNFSTHSELLVPLSSSPA